MAYAQKPDFVFRRKGQVYLNRRGNQFSRLLVGELCTSTCRVCTARAILCSAVMWRLLATHSIRQFPLNFSSRASPCAITFQTQSTTGSVPQKVNWPKCQGEQESPFSGEVKTRVTVSSIAPYIYTPLLLNGHSDGPICYAALPYSTAGRPPIRMRCKRSSHVEPTWTWRKTDTKIFRRQTPIRKQLQFYLIYISQTVSFPKRYHTVCTPKYYKTQSLLFVVRRPCKKSE